MQQLFMGVMKVVETLTNHGKEYFFNLSTLNQLLFVIAILIPFINPIRTNGKLHIAISVIQSVLSFVLFIKIIYTPYQNWFSMMKPIELVMISFALSINDRIYERIKKEIRLSKKRWEQDVQRIKSWHRISWEYPNKQKATTLNEDSNNKSLESVKNHILSNS